MPVMKVEEMGTRIKKNPNLVYEVVCEIAIPPDNTKEPWISWKYPYNYKREDILKSLPSFAYPCEFSNNAVQHFSFVLTNIDSEWTFGFCRHASNSSSCYVILSYLPWHEVFYKILNHIAELTNKEEARKCKGLPVFLENLYHAQIPEPGLQLHVLSSKNEDFVATAPDHEKLPSIPENRNMTEYFNAVDAQNMMIIFASMLHERRILISSKKLSRLSACVQAANALIYPMHWQHIFIPVLPKHLSDYLSAPMPFLIGIPATTLARMKMTDMGDVVYLDADENKIETPFADLDALPSEVLQSLRHDLKRPQEMLGDAVARAFLRALVKLIGGYWNALKLRPTEKITFSPELFVLSRPSAMQPFLQKMLDLQIFQQFIESRLKKLNAGQGVNDEFEFELTAHEDKTSFRLRNQYRDWVTNMKKEGGAFFKNVKTMMKDTSKKAYKDIRSRIQDIHNHTMISDDAPEVPKRRGSAPTTISDLDLHTKNSVKSLHKKESLSKSKADETPVHSALAITNLLTPMSPVRRSVVDSPQLTFQPIDVDLMGDLHEVIFRSCSLCNNSKTSISDPQLIDLSLENKVPCGPSCVASPLKRSSNIPQTPSDPGPPPLLPRPPGSKSRLDTRLSGALSEPSNASAELLIQLDPCSSSNFNEVSQYNSRDSFPDSLEQKNLVNTNPFRQNLSVTSSPDSELSIFKSYSGPNVKNLVNMYQSSSPQHLSSSSEALKANGSVLFKSQNLSRTLSTPPSACSGVYNDPPSMLLLKSASKVSTNPFIVADGKNNNCRKENLNEVSANLSTWENFQ
ncbi:DENN domain-containing protein 1A-like isoform X2 [Argiope bruennichi]|uniref:DENN domain-containing protein 1A-like isoform X2 n=1 Tax=Argiope bruennichi TaxID=94029 RepID=UPI002494F2B2|nr:DENN domain-containing protein 1A-like isoform X2 [Argiope bruennichi]